VPASQAADLLALFELHPSRQATTAPVAYQGRITPCFFYTYRLGKGGWAAAGSDQFSDSISVHGPGFNDL